VSVKKILLSLLVLLVAAGAGAGGWWVWRDRQITAFAATPVTLSAPVTVEIPSGSGPRKVAALLAQAGVVSDADHFYDFVRRDGLAPKLRAGEYAFDGALTPSEVARKIISGEVKVYRFTVPEGLRADEILEIVANSELKLDLAKLTHLAGDSGFLRKAGIPADRIEGFLYPDTYTFTRSANEESVLRKMIGRSLEEYGKLAAETKAGSSLDEVQAFTLASIIEKETGAPDERPRISCVFHNRLRLGMKLQTDPTVLYAMSLLRGAWSKNITKRDLETSHPYNTYTIKGLPPGPIASPGEAALRAALNPLVCNDLFFVSRNDGTHVFCPDLKCHEAAVDKWQREYFRKKRNDN
jgi:UPF0755 protein